MTELDPDAVKHAETCNGVPIFSQDGLDQWAAECSLDDWGVSGCESKAEAGAYFYGLRPGAVDRASNRGVAAAPGAPVGGEA